MKNAGNQKGRNRNGRNAASATVTSGKSIDDGGNVRTNDGSESPTNEQVGAIGSAPESNGINVNGSASRDTGVKITDGYYFTPNGSIERIPDGYFIGNDGRLKKRRNRNDRSNAVDGNESTNRTETRNQDAEFSSEDFLLDKPLNVRGGGRRRKTAKVKEETQKFALVTMIATGCTAIFTSVALLTKHDHWQLHVEEAKHFAQAINEAIATLPSKYYESLTSIIEKWIPWINLAFVASAILIPRIEASAKRVEESYYKTPNANNERDTGSETSYANDEASVGWNQ